MKNRFKIITLLCLVAIIFSDCRKGEDDPFISLRRRKARLAGEWTLTSGLSSMTSIPYGGGAGFSSTESLTENTFAYSSQSGSSNGSYSYKITIDKDGSFSSVEIRTYSGANPNTYTQTKSGTWNFTHGVGKYKNKEQVVFTTTSDMTTIQYPSGSSITTNTTTKNIIDGDGSWILKQLKNKEIVIESNYETFDSGSQDTFAGEFTLEQ